ncbi:MAG: metallophosphoesterase [Planctomycetaceae bacterium]
MSGRTLAIGDIHGCDIALETMLAHLQPTVDDTVVVLGDVVDRGPNTKRCIDLLLELRASCRLVFLLGNHEEMMLDALDGGSWSGSWPAYGGQEVIDSYGGIGNIPEAHLEFMRSGLDYHETQEMIFVHANLQPDVALDQQDADWLRWNHLTGNEQPHPSGKWVVCGHTRLADGVPAILNGWVCIDTFVCGGKYLTCLDTDAFTVHQTNEAGDYQGDVPLGEIAVGFRQ